MPRLKYYNPATEQWEYAVVGAQGPSGIIVSETAPESTNGLWLDSDAVAEVPVPIGGTTGQVLAKSSATDYDTEWTSLPEETMPTGGTTNQVLAKSSSTDYDTEWSTLNAADISDITASATALNSTSSATSGLTALSNGTSGITYQPVSHNHIINGAFDIWQRGTSFTNANSYTADRWNMASTASAGRVVTKEQLTKTEQELIGVKNFLRFDSTAAATYDNRIFQRIEGIELAGKTVTLSAWIRASNSEQSVSLQIRTYANSTNQNTGANSSSQNLTTSWQRYYFQYTVPLIPDFTINANAYHLIALQFSSNPLQVDVTAVQLEVGTVATPFRRNAPSIQAELAACQRYYTSSFPDGVTPGNKSGPSLANGNQLSNYSTTVGNAYTTFKTFGVPMRVSPSVSLFNLEGGSTGTWSLYNSSGGIGAGTPSAVDSNTRGFLVYFGGSTITVTNGGWSASAEL
jgi:hypothetical protein